MLLTSFKMYEKWARDDLMTFVLVFRLQPPGRLLASNKIESKSRVKLVIKLLREGSEHGVGCKTNFPISNNVSRPSMSLSPAHLSWHNRKLETLFNLFSCCSSKGEIVIKSRSTVLGFICCCCGKKFLTVSATRATKAQFFD